MLYYVFKLDKKNKNIQIDLVFMSHQHEDIICCVPNINDSLKQLYCDLDHMVLQ